MLEQRNFYFLKYGSEEEEKSVELLTNEKIIYKAYKYPNDTKCEHETAILG